MKRTAPLPDDFVSFAPGTDIDSALAASVSKFENPFPLDAFPADIRRIIEATNKELNYPTDFTGAAMLFAASVAIGNTRKVRVKRGMELNAVLYLALVGRPNSVKSHPLTFAVHPIASADYNTYRHFEEQKKEFDRLSAIPKSQRTKEGLPDPGLKPVWQKHLLSDYTPEALAEVHKYNIRGLGVNVDELAGWFKSFDKYTKGKGAETEFWLSAWSGKPITIDRKGSDPIYIPSPFISVAGTMQPAILKQLASESRSDNGFMDRMLFAYPEATRKPYWTDSDLAPGITESWADIIESLLNLGVSFDSNKNLAPVVLPFTEDAKRRLFQWQRESTDESNEVESEALSGIFGKFDIHAPRLALILEMLRFACGGSRGEAVGVVALEGALKLAEYFKQTALRVHQQVTDPHFADLLPEDKQDFFTALPDQFTTAEALEIAKKLKVPERTCKHFLARPKLFRKIKRGEYAKRQFTI